MRLFLSGDVMTGRGIDQILPVPGDATLHEPYVRSALDYVRFAERQAGPIPRQVAFDYVWGDAIAAIRERRPNKRIVNLETAITAGGYPDPKGINYRMHPGNAYVLEPMSIDCCVLANNHLGDWGRQGITDTLDVLEQTGIAVSGAGRNARLAAKPAILPLERNRRLLVFAYGTPSSGVPGNWQAKDDAPGINYLPDLGPASTANVLRAIAEWRTSEDFVVVSMHWGGNWGYEIPTDQQRFARSLISDAGVHVVHGHSSHHPKAIEVFEGQPILYGCGDFLNDYEGISGQQAYRPDLVLGYILDLSDATSGFAGLEMLPFRLRRFRLERAAPEAISWLAQRSDRECRRFGSRMIITERDSLRLEP